MLFLNKELVGDKDLECKNTSEYAICLFQMSSFLTLFYILLVSVINRPRICRNKKRRERILIDRKRKL